MSKEDRVVSLKAAVPPKPPMRLTLLLVLMTTASVSALAQQPGTLQDSLKWMHDFVAENSSQYTGQDSIDSHTCKLGSPNCQRRHDVSTFQSQGCSATIMWSVTLNDKDAGTYVYRVSLKDLDPNSVRWVKVLSFQNAVEADTTNSKPAVETFSLPIDKPQRRISQSEVDVLFDTGDHAKRFVEVLKHAIRLCGGKP